MVVEHPGRVIGRRQRHHLLRRERQGEIGEDVTAWCALAQRHPVELPVEQPDAAVSGAGVEYPQAAVLGRRQIDGAEGRFACGRGRPQQASWRTTGVQVENQQTGWLAQAGDEVAGGEGGETAQVGRSGLAHGVKYAEAAIRRNVAIPAKAGIYSDRRTGFRLSPE